MAISTVFCPVILIPAATIGALTGAGIGYAMINNAYKQGIRIGGIQQAKKDKILLEHNLDTGYFVMIRETKKSADLIVIKEEKINLEDKKALRNAFVVEYLTK